MVLEENFAIEDALPHFTSFPAKALRIEHQKGSIMPGMDADLILADEELNITTVIAKGRLIDAGKQNTKKRNL